MCCEGAGSFKCDWTEVCMVYRMLNLVLIAHIMSVGDKVHSRSHAEVSLQSLTVMSAGGVLDGHLLMRCGVCVQFHDPAQKRGRHRSWHW